MTGSPQDSDPTIKPRGLWSVIAHSSSSIPPDEITTAEETASEADPDEQSAPAPRSLFAIMQRGETIESQEDADMTVSVAEEGGAESAVESVESMDVVELDHPYSAVESIQPFVELAGPAGNLRAFAPKSTVRRTRQSSASLLCGVASILLSALSIRPEVWFSIPASAAGFSAIILGYMAITGCRLRDLSSFTKTMSQAGMVLGTVGIFLGPLAFAPLGRELRDSSHKTHSIQQKQLDTSNTSQ